MTSSPPKVFLLSVIALLLACAAVLLLLTAGPGYHFGLWHFRTGFAMMKYGAWLGVTAGVSGCAALVVAFTQRIRKTVIMSSLALAIGAAAFAVPYFWKQSAARVPKIHDISTDTANPPAFVAVLPLRRG